MESAIQISSFIFQSYGNQKNTKSIMILKTLNLIILTSRISRPNGCSIKCECLDCKWLSTDRNFTVSICASQVADGEESKLKLWTWSHEMTTNWLWVPLPGVITCDHIRLQSNSENIYHISVNNSTLNFPFLWCL